MTLSPELSTALTLVALALSTVCFIGCYAAVMFASRISRERRDYRAIISEIVELDDRLSALNDSHKRLRSRFGMRELREKRKSEQNDAEQPDLPEPSRDQAEWKKQMRIKLATGEVKPR